MAHTSKLKDRQTYLKVVQTNPALT